MGVRIRIEAEPLSCECPNCGTAFDIGKSYFKALMVKEYRSKAIEKRFLSKRHLRELREWGFTYANMPREFLV